MNTLLPQENATGYEHANAVCHTAVAPRCRWSD
jgi:hypothetical protein